jgi:hypothetical protein
MSTGHKQQEDPLSILLMDKSMFLNSLAYLFRRLLVLA